MIDKVKTFACGVASTVDWSRRLPVIIDRAPVDIVGEDAGMARLLKSGNEVETLKFEVSMLFVGDGVAGFCSGGCRVLEGLRKVIADEFRTDGLFKPSMEEARAVESRECAEDPLACICTVGKSPGTDEVTIGEVTFSRLADNGAIEPVTCVLEALNMTETLEVTPVEPTIKSTGVVGERKVDEGFVAPSTLLSPGTCPKDVCCCDLVGLNTLRTDDKSRPWAIVKGS